MVGQSSLVCVHLSGPVFVTRGMHCAKRLRPSSKSQPSSSAQGRSALTKPHWEQGWEWISKWKQDYCCYLEAGPRTNKCSYRKRVLAVRVHTGTGQRSEQTEAKRNCCWGCSFFHFLQCPESIELRHLVLSSHLSTSYEALPARCSEMYWLSPWRQLRRGRWN